MTGNLGKFSTEPAADGGGIKTKAESNKRGKKKREGERRGEGREGEGGRREQKQKGEGRKGGRERDVDVEEAGKAKQRREQRTKEGRSSIPLVFSQLTQYANTGGHRAQGQPQLQLSLHNTSIQ